MDALYYIGGGSMRDNNELRLSLRALEKHCKDLGNVFIVGNKPPFLSKEVNYIWVDDKYEWWKNAFEKTKAAIKACISEDFLLMNDDFFMTGDFEAAKYPYYHRGKMPDCSKTQYQEVISNTKKLLEKLGKTTLHYGVHCPMRINGQKYLEMEKYYKEPVSARCLYGNLYAVGGQRIEDPKGDVFKKNKNKCWSSRTWLMDDALAELKKIYDKPSKFEKEE